MVFIYVKLPCQIVEIMCVAYIVYSVCIMDFRSMDFSVYSNTFASSIFCGPKDITIRVSRHLTTK